MSPARPFVSVLTPTRDRRLFIPQLLRQWRLQTWPLNQMELVVADDGDDPVADLLDGQPGVRYLPVAKMTLGAKRNLLCAEARGDILVHMDDDDHYPRRRVEHAVQTLLKSPCALAGSSEMLIYNLRQRVLYRSGPFGPLHGTNGTFAYKREYLQENRFDDAVSVRDEHLFTRGFSQPMVQLDPRQTIVCIQHMANTWDKSQTSMQDAGLALKDVVLDKEALRFYRYQLPRRLGLAADD
jgi:glycosyltransferase involved in cell wall biosynthesis